MNIRYKHQIFYEKGGKMDYKEMYLKMVRASEEAMNILIKVQRECEEMYLNAEESEPADITDNEQ